MLLAVGCGTDTAKDSSAGQAVVTVTAAAPAVTATVTAAPTKPKAGAAPTTSTTTTAAAGAGNDVGDNRKTFVMPNEVGNGLQDAQDDLQAVSGDPLFYSGSKDATDQGRGQWWDADWKVCSQNVAADSQVPDDDMDIVFAVVKVDEHCP